MPGLNYVSCSPYRVPLARLAAAGKTRVSGIMEGHTATILSFFSGCLLMKRSPSFQSYKEAQNLATQLGLDMGLVMHEIQWALGEERINRVTPSKERFQGWTLIVDAMRQAPRPEAAGAGSMRLADYGISPTQASELRTDFATFAGEWERAEMDVYDDYDAAKARLEAAT